MADSGFSDDFGLAANTVQSPMPSSGNGLLDVSSAFAGVAPSPQVADPTPDTSPQDAEYEKLWSIVDKQQLGEVEVAAAASFMGTSRLAQTQLGAIWGLAITPTSNGNVSKDNMIVALKLIAAVQNDRPVSLDSVTPDLPLPKLALEQPPTPEMTKSSSNSGDNIDTMSAWDHPIPPGSVNKFESWFSVADDDHDGKVTGEAARDLMGKSGLPINELAAIWRLSDMDGDGLLNHDEFIIAMHMVSGRRAGLPIPSSLPPSMIPEKKVEDVWIVSDEEWDKYVQNFRSMDKKGTGFIDASAARSFLSQSHLPTPVLRHIWALADSDKDGQLREAEFIAAVILTQRVRGGSEVPQRMPESLERRLALPQQAVSPQDGLGLTQEAVTVPQGAVTVPQGAVTVPEETAPLDVLMATPNPVADIDTVPTPTATPIASAVPILSRNEASTVPTLNRGESVLEMLGTMTPSGAVEELTRRRGSTIRGDDMEKALKQSIARGQDTLHDVTRAKDELETSKARHALIIEEMTRLRHVTTALEVEAADYEQMTKDQTKAILGAEEELERLKAQNELWESQTTERKSALQKSKDRLFAIHGQCVLMQQRIDAVHQDEDEEDGDMDNVKGELETAQKRLEELTKMKTMMENRLTQRQAQAEERISERIRMQSASKEIMWQLEQLQSQMNEQTIEMEENRIAIKECLTEQQQLQAKTAEAQRMFDENRRKLRDQDSALRDAMLRQKEAEVEYGVVGKMVQEALDEKSSLEAELVSSKEALAAQRKRIEGLQSEHDRLRALRSGNKQRRKRVRETRLEHEEGDLQMAALESRLKEMREQLDEQPDDVLVVGEEKEEEKGEEKKPDDAFGADFGSFGDGGFGGEKEEEKGEEKEEEKGEEKGEEKKPDDAFGADFGSFGDVGFGGEKEEEKSEEKKPDDAFGADFGSFGDRGFGGEKGEEKSEEKSEEKKPDDAFGADFGSFGDVGFGGEKGEEKKPDDAFGADFGGFGDGGFGGEKGEEKEEEKGEEKKPDDAFGADFGSFGDGGFGGEKGEEKSEEKSEEKKPDDAFGADFGSFGDVGFGGEKGEEKKPDDAFGADFGSFGDGGEKEEEKGEEKKPDDAFGADFGSFGDGGFGGEKGEEKSEEKEEEKGEEKKPDDAFGADFGDGGFGGEKGEEKKPDDAFGADFGSFGDGGFGGEKEEEKGEEKKPDDAFGADFGSFGDGGFGGEKGEEKEEEKGEEKKPDDAFGADFDGFGDGGFGGEKGEEKKPDDAFGADFGGFGDGGEKGEEKKPDDAFGADFGDGGFGGEKGEEKKPDDAFGADFDDPASNPFEATDGFDAKFEF